MHVPDIIEVKNHLDRLMAKGLVDQWELPYENLLTRRSAAIFFINPSRTNDAEKEIAKELIRYPEFSVRENEEKKLSQMRMRVTFSKEEREKNELKKTTVSQGDQLS